jgi:hypothetical protein
MVKNTAAAIDRARTALADTEAKITDVTAKRAARLLAGDTAAAIGKLNGELDALRHAAATERDRIALLEKEAEKEAAERRASEKSALIERAEAKHTGLATAAAELQGHLVAADASFRKMLKRLYPAFLGLAENVGWLPDHAVFDRDSVGAMLIAKRLTRDIKQGGGEMNGRHRALRTMPR